MCRTFAIRLISNTPSLASRPSPPPSRPRLPVSPSTPCDRYKPSLINLTSAKMIPHQFQVMGPQTLGCSSKMVNPFTHTANYPAHFFPKKLGVQFCRVWLTYPCALQCLYCSQVGEEVLPAGISHRGGSPRGTKRQNFYQGA